MPANCSNAAENGAAVYRGLADLTGRCRGLQEASSGDADLVRRYPEIIQKDRGIGEAPAATRKERRLSSKEPARQQMSLFRLCT